MPCSGRSGPASRASSTTRCSSSRSCRTCWWRRSSSISGTTSASGGNSRPPSSSCSASASSATPPPSVAGCSGPERTAAMSSYLPPPARTGSGGRAFRFIGLVLLVLLGFALAVSVRTNRGPAGLASARQEDLVRILDDLDSRAGRLRDQVTDLQRSRDRLAGSEGDQAALEEARQRADQLGVLAG